MYVLQTFNTFIHAWVRMYIGCTDIVGSLGIPSSDAGPVPHQTTRAWQMPISDLFRSMRKPPLTLSLHAFGYRRESGCGRFSYRPTMFCLELLLNGTAQSSNLKSASSIPDGNLGIVLEVVDPSIVPKEFRIFLRSCTNQDTVDE